MATRKAIADTTPSAAADTQLRRRRRCPTEDEEATVAGAYFASGSDKENIQFTSTGCALFDEALGGGPALGRVINIVGDKSSGKTLIAMEIMAQTLLRYPTAWCRYGEAEAAWDREYADALGIPTNKIILNEKDTRIETVEQWYDDLEKCLDQNKGPGVYVLDSLDSISDDAEMEGDFNKASFGGAKPKAIGQLFRRLVGRLEEQGVLLIVISQLRDKLNVTFGETKTRSGGRALDFYCTHIVWLAEIEKQYRTFLGQKRVTGIQVEAYVKKNKVGLAFRRARYPVLFGYGIDDLTASVEWLIDIGQEKKLHALGMKKGASERAKTKAEARKKEAEPEDSKTAALKPYDKMIEEVRNQGGAPARDLREKLTAMVRSEWMRIEMELLPKGKKY